MWAVMTFFFFDIFRIFITFLRRSIANLTFSKYNQHQKSTMNLYKPVCKMFYEWDMFEWYQSLQEWLQKSNMYLIEIKRNNILYRTSLCTATYYIFQIFLKIIFEY